MSWFFRMAAATCALVLVSVPALAAQPTDASEPALDGFEVSAGVGISEFVQEGHAPPICCGERDSWGLIGPRLQLTVGWLPIENFRLSLRFDRFQASSKEADPELPEGIRREIISHAAQLGADLRIPVAPVVPFVGLEFGPELINGRFNQVDDPTVDLALLLGLHAGVEWPFTKHFSLGIDARYARSFVYHRLDALLTFGWTSG